MSTTHIPPIRLEAGCAIVASSGKAFRAKLHAALDESAPDGVVEIDCTGSYMTYGWMAQVFGPFVTGADRREHRVSLVNASDFLLDKVAEWKERASGKVAEKKL